jgi:hypothetical protein
MSLDIPITEFSDDQLRIIGSADGSKKLAFEVDGITTGTVRTLTPQNASYTLAGINITQSFSEQQIIEIATDVIPFRIKQDTIGATAHFLDCQDVLGTDLFHVTIAGVIQGTKLVGTQVEVEDGLGIVIHDGTDSSKTLRFELGSSTANADLTLDYRSAVDRSLIWNLSGGTGGNLTMTWAGTANATLTLPTATDTLMGRNTTDTITGPKTIDLDAGGALNYLGGVTSTLIQWTDSVSGNNVLITAPAAITASIRTITIPDLDGTLMLLGGAQSVTGAKTFGVSAGIFSSSTASSGCSFADTTTNTKRLRMVLSGAVGNNSLTFTTTAARNYGYLNEAGNIGITGAASVGSGANATAQAPGKVDSTGLTADFASAQVVTSPTAGMWRIDCYLECTTSAAGATLLTSTWGWTDDVGATTDATQTLIQTATGRSSFSRIIYVASGHITLTVAATTHSTAVYAIRARATFLG